MAKVVLALLEYSNAWIDPNLADLVGSGDDSKTKKQKRQGVEKKQKEQANEERMEDILEAVKNEADGNNYGDGDGDDWDDGEFANLNANRILLLKRAGHVSDASSDSG
jgi:hypothetical protein